MIREATADDVEAIVTMGLRFLLSPAYRHICTPEPVALVNVVNILLERGVIFVADLAAVVPGVCVDIDGQRWHPAGGCAACKPNLVGMICILVAGHPFTGQLYGDEVAWWVEPEYRTGRIGYNLLRTAEDWSRQNGLSVLKMVAPAGSPEVGTFYERVGFTLVESAYQKQLTVVGRSSTTT